ncbi:15-hydroxyprostaglandin dehydrogenase [NAD(+)] isoform X2 [Trematomus bernacchii]|uniref:15-hydroxyprostaglandin dehydrogenase [NAD(+)] isoform X2 n=1 Tax=Trematomus bernacchii TaxID=40690 RepID=UPI00146F58AD|nr:15-hydroxyprostaglandin dehydrogenase [NAD(+)] isoform X2 [Trematomus bernacchii]
MPLRGKVALVTGGAQGIGRAVVQSLLQSSAKVAVVDLNKTCGEESKALLDAEFGEGHCHFIPCDVSNGDALREAFQNTVEQFGRLDIVINNAGINNEKNWEKTIQVNLTSVIKGTYLALEHMSKEYGKEGGIIINVSSMPSCTPLTSLSTLQLNMESSASLELWRTRPHKAITASGSTFCARPSWTLLCCTQWNMRTTWASLSSSRTISNEA